MKTKKDLQKENEILWSVIKDTFWMSIRYANGRHTFAPEIVRECANKLKKLGFKLKEDRTIKVDADMMRKYEKNYGIALESDYLDDLFEE